MVFSCECSLRGKKETNEKEIEVSLPKQERKANNKFIIEAKPESILGIPQDHRCTLHPRDSMEQAWTQVWAFSAFYDPHLYGDKVPEALCTSHQLPAFSFQAYYPSNMFFLLPFIRVICASNRRSQNNHTKRNITHISHSNQPLLKKKSFLTQLNYLTTYWAKELENLKLFTS